MKQKNIHMSFSQVNQSFCLNSRTEPEVPNFMLITQISYSTLENFPQGQISHWTQKQSTIKTPTCHRQKILIPSKTQTPYYHRKDINFCLTLLEKLMSRGLCERITEAVAH